MEKVCVIMSTYNGETYVLQQIESIMNQEGIESVLYIRDDGSSDRTVSIVKRHHLFNRRIFLIEGENCGTTMSFFLAMRYVNELNLDIGYYAFADQDDVWLPEKLKVAIDVLKDYDNNVPNLYYSNLKCVNRNLDFLYHRFRDGYVHNTKRQALAEICVLGCTCVFNQKTLEEMAHLSLNKLDAHDNWILWVCIFLGNVYYDVNPHIFYRQHGQNVSGEVKKGFKYVSYQLIRIKEIKKLHPCHEIRARNFLECYAGQLSLYDRKSLEMLAYYRKNTKYKFCLFFGNRISSGHFVKEISRRLRMIMNNL